MKGAELRNNKFRYERVLGLTVHMDESHNNNIWHFIRDLMFISKFVDDNHRFGLSLPIIRIGFQNDQIPDPLNPNRTRLKMDWQWQAVLAAVPKKLWPKLNAPLPESPSTRAIEKSEKPVRQYMQVSRVARIYGTLKPAQMSGFGAATLQACASTHSATSLWRILPCVDALHLLRSSWLVNSLGHSA